LDAWSASLPGCSVAPPHICPLDRSVAGFCDAYPLSSRAKHRGFISCHLDRSIAALCDAQWRDLLPDCTLRNFVISHQGRCNGETQIAFENDNQAEKPLQQRSQTRSKRKPLQGARARRRCVSPHPCYHEREAGLSTAAAKAPPPVEMTKLRWVLSRSGPEQR